jgi:hypothetical protein
MKRNYSISIKLIKVAKTHSQREGLLAKPALL